ncbi:Pre-mRNA-splicing factor SPF27 [Parachaetomium inaequale]|uniref:Pre-mRNA-splicing factor SPF27 n=1 Tax=Parachaetomium inaequale TaxID=2588326 RepID=A0AAN6SM80_9PEZI|nr:Pre-mRNA-splicing factor SPF27 [Parachaetomium inaequale]
MPITIVHESLPYIDPDPTPTERAAAEALIAAERALVPDDPYHALLPPPASPTPFLTPLLTTELTRLSSAPTPQKSKLSALDFTRYEAPDPPNTSGLPPSKTIPLLQTALTAAYTSHTYISSRRAHLALLDSYGKNAWLVGNHQLEGELKALERELAEARRKVDLVTLNRKEAQDAVAAEMVSLGEAWKSGVGRVLETEAAVEGVRREVLGVRRRVAEGE